MRLAHAMIGAFSYMRYSYHGDFMIPKIEVGTDQDFLLIMRYLLWGVPLVGGRGHEIAHT